MTRSHGRNTLRSVGQTATIVRHYLFALCTIAALHAPGTPARAQCIDYRDFIHWESIVYLPGSGSDVAAAGSLAYVADGDAGLQVIGAADLTVPRIVGSVDTPGVASGVAVAGSLAYVADGDAGLQVVDISNPAGPRLVGGVDTPGSAREVAVAGTFAYVADRYSGLQVIDISDPTAPAIAGGVDTPGSARGVAVSGAYAYVADRLGGLQVIDVSNPGSPVIVGSVATPASARGVTVAGTHAYVAADAMGLLVIDVSNPVAPVIVGELDLPLGEFSLPSRSRGVTVVGSHAYVAAEAGGLFVVDIAHPASPEIVGSAHTRGRPIRVDVAGSRAYVLGEYNTVEVIGVSTPTSPAIVGSADTPGNASGVAITGSHAFVCDGETGMQVIDISNPAAPVRVGSVDTPCIATGVDVEGPYAYVADGYALLDVIDISNPAAPRIVGSAGTLGNALAVAVAGSYAYVADGRAGLQVIDVSNATAPKYVGGIWVPGWAVDVDIADSRAYVSYVSAYAIPNEGVEVIDISDPHALAIVATTYRPPVPGEIPDPLPGGGGGPYPAGIAVSGRYAYRAHGGLQVIDVSNPGSLEFVGTSIGSAGFIGDVTVVGSCAYVARRDGLEVFDLTNPESPVPLGDVRLASGALGVAVAGSVACVAAAGGGLLVLPAQCTPAVITALAAEPREESILLRWRASSTDFATFDVLRSTGPVHDGSTWTRIGVAARTAYGAWRYTDAAVRPGATYSYRVAGYLADGGSLESSPIEVSALPRGRFAVGPVLPFPARDTAVIAFALPHPESVRLEVYDVRGRRVRQLLDAMRGTGEHIVAWDGRDGNGANVSSGVYFVRLSWPGGALVTRSAFVR